MNIRNEGEAFTFAFLLIMCSVALPVAFISHILDCRPKDVPEIKFKVTKPELRDYFATIGKK